MAASAYSIIVKANFYLKFMSKKVFINTFCCQMNDYDSDKMANVLDAA